MTGLEWVRESGQLTTPIAITNTHSVGVVRDALIAAEVRDRAAGDVVLVAPGRRRDLRRRAERHQRHAREARARLRGAGRGRGGPVPEGNVGGGTGMICHEFKGGIGTASRVVETRLARSACSCRRTTATASASDRRRAGRRARSRRASPVRRGTRGGDREARRRLDHRRSSRPTRRSCPTSATRLAQRAGLGHRAMGGSGRALQRRHLPGVLDRATRGLAQLQEDEARRRRSP